MVELHQEGSAPAACAAGLFLNKNTLIVLPNSEQLDQGITLAFLMVEKSCLVTDILPNNDICNKFGETWSEIMGDLFSSSIYS